MQDRSDVVLMDIQVPFRSLVFFMVKWTIASLPAVIILLFLGGIIAAWWGVFSGS